ncbi:MAG: Sensor histidine kinase RcsC [Acidobacteria bacterium]|nr:Sensor histidine kinase RcsC [Acidobacteriota bacterium]
MNFGEKVVKMSSRSWNKVLIVDDEPAIRLVVGEALRGSGYETIEAGTGAEALATLDATCPAAVLLDINLPDSYGLDLLREIKRRQPQTAVIMVTAETLFENAVSALRGGADDFIGKPINLDELHFALDQAINLKRQGREPAAISRPRALILSDSAERISQWQAAFDPQEAEITCALFPEEWNYVSRDAHDLAVVDVGPALLESLLKNLRASQEHAEIPVLVESGRTAAGSPAGLLPKYRAMPCSHDELIRLARRRITFIASHGLAKGIL